MWRVRTLPASALPASTSRTRPAGLISPSSRKAVRNRYPVAWLGKLRSKRNGFNLPPISHPTPIRLITRKRSAQGAASGLKERRAGALLPLRPAGACRAVSGPQRLEGRQNPPQRRVIHRVPYFLLFTFPFSEPCSPRRARLPASKGVRICGLRGTDLRFKVYGFAV